MQGLCQPAYVESDQTLVCTGAQIEMVCFDINKRNSTSLTYSPYTISKLRVLLKEQ